MDTDILDIDDINQLAHLARLHIEPNTAQEVASRITQILALVDQLKTVDTDGIAPMSHPLSLTQRLRSDTVSEPDMRESLQASAPSAADGLFLVPKVLD